MPCDSASSSSSVNATPHWSLVGLTATEIAGPALFGSTEPLRIVAGFDHCSVFGSIFDHNNSSSAPVPSPLRSRWTNTTRIPPSFVVAASIWLPHADGSAMPFGGAATKRTDLGSIPAPGTVDPAPESESAPSRTEVGEDVPAPLWGSFTVVADFVPASDDFALQPAVRTSPMHSSAPAKRFDFCKDNVGFLFDMDGMSCATLERDHPGSLLTSVQFIVPFRVIDPGPTAMGALRFVNVTFQSSPKCAIFIPAPTGASTA